MAELHLSTERCKSCEFCVFSCPSKALKLSGKLNNDGYDYVENDNEKCIKCGICYTVCPDNVFTITE